MTNQSRAQTLLPTPENLQLAADALRSGDVVAMPTETVYGLAGHAFRPEALAKIFSVKERPTFDPLILHVGPLARGIEQLRRLDLVDTKALSERAKMLAEILIEKFWPGPLTLVLPKSSQVPDLATSGLTTVALRMPRHPIAQALIAYCQAPLAAPSANRFGRISPTTAAHVQAELGDRIGLIVDGGACTVGIESTIVSVSESGELTVLRPGGLAREEIERATGVPIDLFIPGSKISAPGMLTQHYSPRKPLRMLPDKLFKLDDFSALASGKMVGLLLLSGKLELAQAHCNAHYAGKVIIEILSPSGDLSEAAQNLFAKMRALDESAAEVIWAEPCENAAGLGYAIQDRLKRASAIT